LKLSGLASSSNVASCSAASGFSMIPPSGMPSDEQQLKMCATQSCWDLMKEISDLNPSDCELSFGSVSINVAKLVADFEPSCKTTDAPSPDSPSPDTPAPSTEKPAC
jgi:hypothetical protein